jgi:hypothetical protein
MTTGRINQVTKAYRAQSNKPARSYPFTPQATEQTGKEHNVFQRANLTSITQTIAFVFDNTTYIPVCLSVAILPSIQRYLYIHRHNSHTRAEQSYSIRSRRFITNMCKQAQPESQTTQLKEISTCKPNPS